MVSAQDPNSVLEGWYKDKDATRASLKSSGYSDSDIDTYFNYLSQRTSNPLSFFGWTPHSIDTIAGSKHADDAKQAAADSQAQQSASDAAAQKAQNQSITDKINQYYQEMSKPLDLKDPYVQNIMRGASANLRQDANSQGVQGGLADVAAARAGTDSANQYQMARLGLAGNALGMASNRNTALQQLQLQKDEFGYGAAQNAYANGMSQAQANGALVGGLGGAIPGLLTMNPALAAGGATAGASILSGAAGNLYKSNNPYPTPRGGLSGAY